jgi:hypothetical protein
MSDFLTWLAEAKSPIFRQSVGLGCLGASALGGILILAVLMTGAMVHCTDCDTSWVGRELTSAIALASGFGLCAGIVTALAKPLLTRAFGSRASLVILGLCTLVVALLCYQPAYRMVEQVEYGSSGSKS